MTLLPLLLACAGTDTDDTGRTCDDAPVVTWDSFGEALLDEHCQPCHASTAPEDRRFGAPEAVTFDTKELALGFADDIVRVATPEDATMPPAVSIGQTDKDLLWYWLSCSDEAVQAQTGE